MLQADKLTGYDFYIVSTVATGVCLRNPRPIILQSRSWYVFRVNILQSVNIMDAFI